jgi:hypothetical protein
MFRDDSVADDCCCRRPRRHSASGFVSAIRAEGKALLLWHQKTRQHAAWFQRTRGGWLVSRQCCRIRGGQTGNDAVAGGGRRGTMWWPSICCGGQPAGMDVVWWHSGTCRSVGPWDISTEIQWHFLQNNHEKQGVNWYTGSFTDAEAREPGLPTLLQHAEFALEDQKTVGRNWPKASTSFGLLLSGTYKPV